MDLLWGNLHDGHDAAFPEFLHLLGMSRRWVILPSSPEFASTNLPAVLNLPRSEPMGDKPALRARLRGIVGLREQDALDVAGSEAPHR